MSRQNGFSDSSTPRVITVEQEAGFMCTKCEEPLLPGDKAIDSSGKLHIHCFA